MTPSTNELEKLRDILVGEQMRQLDERLTALETNLRNLSEQINGKISALSSENKKHHASQSNEINRLAVEQSTKLKEQGQGLVGQIEALRKQAEADAKQSQKRDENIKKELLALLAQLDASKVARSELGKALTELGQVLNHE